MGHLNVINLQSKKMRKLSLAQSHLKDAVTNLLPEQTSFSIVLVHASLFQKVLKIKSGVSFIYIFIANNAVILNLGIPVVYVTMK